MPKIKPVAKKFWALMGPEYGKFALNTSGAIIMASNRDALTKMSPWRRCLKVVQVKVEILETD